MPETTQFNVNMPYVATINADGSLTIETIKHQSYQLTAADLDFSAYLLNGVFKSFMVSDEISGATALLNVDLNVDLSGDFMKGFIRNLQYAPSVPSDQNVAIDAPPAESAVFLQAWLEGVARSALADELVDNGVAAALEASDLSPLEITNFEEDASAGAANMWNGINGLVPQMRSLIATQIQNKSYMDISMNAEVMQGLLPIRANDTMTFQFIVNQQYSVSELQKNVGPDAGGMVGVGETAYNMNTRPLGTYGVGSKRINVIMKRIDGAEYRDLSGAANAFEAECVSAKQTASTTANTNYNTAEADVPTKKGHMNAAYNTLQECDASYNLAKSKDVAYTVANAKYQDLSGALAAATTTAAAAIGTPQHAELVHLQEHLEADVAIALAAKNIAFGLSDTANTAALKTLLDTAKNSTYPIAVGAYNAAVTLLRLRAGQRQAAKDAYEVVRRRYEGLLLKRDAAKDTAEFNEANARAIYNDVSGAYYAADSARSQALTTATSKSIAFIDASGAYAVASSELNAAPGDTAKTAAYGLALEVAQNALVEYTAARALAVASRTATITALGVARAAESQLRLRQYQHAVAQEVEVFVSPTTVDPAEIGLQAAPAALIL